MLKKAEDAIRIQKNGVKMKIYSDIDDCMQGAVVYQETDKGHLEEFYHLNSAFIYYIIDGNGTFYIEGKAHTVKKADVVIIPPGSKFYYKGQLKQVCVTAPAWEPQYERHVRFVETS